MCVNKSSIGGFRGVRVSSIGNSGYQGSFKFLCFFKKEDFEQTKRKQANKKTKRQHFYAHKNI